MVEGKQGSCHLRRCDGKQIAVLKGVASFDLDERRLRKLGLAKILENCYQERRWRSASLIESYDFII